MALASCSVMFSSMQASTGNGLQLARTLTQAAGLVRSFAGTSTTSTATNPQLESSSAAPGSNHAQAIYAACVLERLPIIMQKPPLWEVEHQLWVRSQNLQQGFTKEYPRQAPKEGQREGAASSQPGQQDLRKFEPVPCSSQGDAPSPESPQSMKRHLDQRLYLIVKQGLQVAGPGKSGGASWQFPTVQHEAGEAIRQTGERALYSAIGRAHPIYFIGNTPMAHLTSGQTGSPSTFFMLAQAVGDPWQARLKEDSGCKGVAWVTKDELQHYIQDPRLKDLILRML